MYGINGTEFHHLQMSNDIQTNLVTSKLKGPIKHFELTGVRGKHDN